MAETPQSIRAVIFDYGGVLMRTASLTSREQLAQRMGIPLTELNRLAFESEDARLAQLGQMPSQQRWANLCQQLGLRALEDIEAFHNAMFANDELDQELAAYIRRLHNRVKTALLSNATLRLESTLRELHIEDCFDVIIISALVGLMKPDPAIYNLTLQRLGIAPQQAVFVDDMPQNVEAAQTLGIHGIRFTTREAVIDELDALLGGQSLPGGTP